MRENVLLIMFVALLFLGFFSSTFTGQAPRGAVLDSGATLAGSGAPPGNREYQILRGLRYDTIGSPGREGYSLLFNNPFPPGKGDLDDDGRITKNDLAVLQIIYSRAIGKGTALQGRLNTRWLYSEGRSTNNGNVGIYSLNGDMNDDGQITFDDVKLLQRLLNPYLGVKTSYMNTLLSKSNCKYPGAQTCAVDKRGQIGTCKEIVEGGAQYGLLAYSFEPCPAGMECTNKGHGEAACTKKTVNRQAPYGYAA